MIAEIPELPGCIVYGGNEYESIKNILDAKKLWIDTALEFGDNIPEPKGRLIFT